MSDVTINLGELQNTCFVVMPFDPLYQTEYEKVIQPTLDELEIECIRGDEIYRKQRIMDDIWHSIRCCRFVIAELTGRNPNVLYEVGLAHAIGKPVLIITRNEEDVPFDLKDLRYLYYNVNDPFWGDNLKAALKGMIIKIIESPEIEKYLEEIKVPPKSDYPVLSNDAFEHNQSNKLLDVNGTWLGEFEVNKLKHDVVINITQKDRELFAIAVISFDLATDNPSIVQQTMNGFVNRDDQVTLTGVNYTFIKRGSQTDYEMDSFILKPNGIETELVGDVTDANLNKNGGIGSLMLKKQI